MPWGDHDRVRLGQGLQPCREIGGFTDDRLFLRRTFADHIADYDQPRGGPDPRLELDGFDVELTDSGDQFNPARTARSASSSWARG